ncbi:MAG: DMT family transporter [Myxococcales bacterium]
MIRRAPLASLGGASLCFAAMATFARVESARGFDAAQLVFARMGVGALACLVLFATGRARFALRRPAGLLARGTFGSVAILLYFFALTRLPVGEATLLNYTSPLFTTLFAMLFLGERPGPRLFASLLVTLIGLALTVDATSGAHLSWGLAAGLGSAVMSGAAVATVRSLRRSEGAAMIFFVFCGVALVISGPLAVPGARLPAARDAWLLLGIGAASTLAQLLFTEAMGFVSAAGAAVVTPLTPIAAYLLGAFFLGEPLTARIVLGMAIALGGVALGSRFGRGAVGFAESPAPPELPSA